jgi:hypothetical protein
MRMVPIRNYSGIRQQSVQARQVEERKRQNDLSVFNLLRGMLQKSEYDAMLAQWHSGEREVWIKDGLIITCYTPAEREEC